MLNIGDTYTLQGRKVKVVGFDYEGRYIVERVDSSTLEAKITKPDVIIEPTKEEITNSNVNYEDMPIKELQQLCKDRGLAIRGSKADVIKRLKG